MKEHYRFVDKWAEEESRSCFSGGTFSPADFGDSFLRMVYDYHRKGGLGRLVCKSVGEMVVYLFIAFIGGPALGVGLLLYMGTEEGQWGTAGLDGSLDYLGHNLLPFYARYSQVFYLLGAYGVYLGACQARALHRYSKVRAFYAHKLDISTVELHDLTWHGVLDKLIPALNKMAPEHRVDELSLYQRILRFDNYMIAMMNRGIISYRYRLPCFGEFNFFLKLFQMNLERILFYWNFLGCNLFGWRFFDSQERFVVKKSERIEKYASRFRRMCVCLAVVQAVLAVPLLAWNVLAAAFRYGWVPLVDPSCLMARVFTPSAKLRLRHLGELKHESKARYNQALGSVNPYLDTFSGSPFRGLQQAAMVCAGGLYVILIVLYNLDWKENSGKLFSHLYVVLSICRILYCVVCKNPKVTSRSELMKSIIAKLVYVPDHWETTRGRTESARAEVDRQFPRKWKMLVADILSPITTVVLLLHLRRRAYEILHFLQESTVETAGAGHVCSYSTLDLEAHGSFRHTGESPAPGWRYRQSTRGKVELSLHNFCLNNPRWKIPARFRPGLESTRRFLYPLEEDLDKTYASASSLVTPRVVPRYPSNPRNAPQDHDDLSERLVSSNGRRSPDGFPPTPWEQQQMELNTRFAGDDRFQTHKEYENWKRQRNESKEIKQTQGDHFQTHMEYENWKRQWDETNASFAHDNHFQNQMEYENKKMQMNPPNGANASFAQGDQFQNQMEYENWKRQWDETNASFAQSDHFQNQMECENTKMQMNPHNDANPIFAQGDHFQPLVEYENWKRQMNPPELWFYPNGHVQPPMNERTDRMSLPYQSPEAMHSPPNVPHESRTQSKRPQTGINPPKEHRIDFPSAPHQSAIDLEENRLMQKAEDIHQPSEDQGVTEPLNNSEMRNNRNLENRWNSRFKN